MIMPGNIMAVYLTAIILGITLGLFISLPISYNNPKNSIKLLNNKD